MYHVHSSIFFHFIHHLMHVDVLDSKFSDESDDLADEGISGPERGYRGPHLVFPLQKKDIDTLIELFRKKKVFIQMSKFVFKYEKGGNRHNKGFLLPTEKKQLIFHLFN